MDASIVGNERSRSEARGSQTPTVWAALEEGPSRVRAIAELPPLWLGRSRLVYDVTAFLPSLPTHTPMRYFRLLSGGIARVFSRRLAPGSRRRGGHPRAPPPLRGDEGGGPPAEGDERQQ